jgi:hypothetical protein
MLHELGNVLILLAAAVIAVPSACGWAACWDT